MFNWFKKDKWPNDADGDVLRRMQQSGFDFNKEVAIDFAIEFEQWPVNERVTRALEEYCPEFELVATESDTEKGFAQFQIFGLVTYELVTSTQATANQKFSQYRGICESWGVLQS